MNEMSIIVAIVGAADLGWALPTIGSLATYFGERPLEIRLYDTNEEQLDLVERFARKAFTFSKATHVLLSSSNIEVSIREANRLIHQSPRIGQVDFEGEVLILQPAPQDIPYQSFRLLEWTPPHLKIDSIPYQLLRWIHEEEYMHELFALYEQSPLKKWLDDPTTMPLKQRG